MPSEKKLFKRIRLRKLCIRNYKAIDKLQIVFPLPRMAADPNILVIGSKNGVGKTSVLESISVLMLSILTNNQFFNEINRQGSDVDFIGLMIRSGQESAQISGDFEYLPTERSKGWETAHISLEIFPGERGPYLKGAEELMSFLLSPSRTLIHCTFGMDYDPLEIPHLLYFHSYRKISEGNPDVRTIIGDNRHYSQRYRASSKYRDFPVGLFKTELLKLMMGNSGLLEGFEKTFGEKSLTKINEIALTYAGATFEKLRPTSENAFEFRIKQAESKQTYAFDGLSSGQKEIITTLFLLWHYTKNSPRIVLIDEPELHLNAEWHKIFINSLYDLCPDNQYIIATHSQDVFASVDKKNRVLIAKERKK